MLRKSRKADKKHKAEQTENYDEHLPFGALKRVIFRAAFLLESDQRESRSPQLSTQFVYFTLCAVYTAMCLTVYSSVSTSALPQLWSALRWCRLDYLAWEGVATHGVFAAFGLVWVHALTFLLVCIQCARRTPPAQRLVSFLPLFKWKFLAVLDVPLGAMLLSHIFPACETCLYGPEASAVPWVPPVACVSFLAFFAQCCFRELVFTQNDHSKTSTDICARTTLAVECVRLAMTQVISASYFLLSEAHPIEHLLVLVAACCVVLGGYYLRMPYYNVCASQAIVSVYSFLGVSGLCALCGSLTSSRLFPTLGTLAIAPAFAGLSAYHFHRTSQYAHLYYSLKLKRRVLPLHQVEFAVRLDLCRSEYSDDSKRSTIEALLRIFHTHERNKEVMMWVVDLALAKVEDTELARVKLAQVIDREASFEVDYHSYKHYQNLNRQQASAGLEYLTYFHKLLAIKHLDKVLCLAFLRLFKAIISKKGDSTRLCLYSREIYLNMSVLKAEYKELIKTYPNSKEAANLFASFLNEVAHANDKANGVRMRSGTLCYEESRHVVYADYDSTVTFFQQGTCILFAEASKAQFCRISYANDLTHIALGYEVGELVGMSLAALVPKPFCEGHVDKVGEFLENGADVNCRHPSLLYFVTKGNYILECVVTISFTARATQPQILVAFKPSSSYKQTAIFSSSFCITACTKDFLSIAGLRTHPHALSTPLKDLHPYLWSAKWRYGFTHYFRMKSTARLFGLFCEFRVSNLAAVLLHFFDTEEEAKRWLKFVRGNREGEWDSDDGAPRYSASGDRWYHSEVSDVSHRSRSQLEICPPRSSGKRSTVQFSSWPDAPSQSHSRLSIMSSGVSYNLSGPQSVLTTTSSISRSARKLLITDLQTKFKLLKLVTVVAMAVLVSGSIIIGSFVTTAVTDVVALDRTNDYIMRAFQVLRMAQNARYIHLSRTTNPASIPSVPYFQEVVKNAALELKAIQSTLMRDPENRDLRENVVIWELLDTEASMRRVNLLQAMDILADQVASS